MNEFRRLAVKIDQHMQQLSAQGVSEAHVIFDRMVGYVPDLHKIWVGTTDDQLIALCNEFPGFYRYAFIMEEASKIENNKVSRPYDGITKIPLQNKPLADQLLTTAATLERGYQAFRGSGNLQVFQPQVNELDRLHRQWLSDLDSFKSSLRAQGVEPKALEYVNEAFGRLAERIKKLAG
ncbi:transposase [Propionivibrio sp.]|uniref:transposase n=1 Tax=Propionivibrio sp. TaxID=2212460 RepID=UPI003BF0EC86